MLRLAETACSPSRSPRCAWPSSSALAASAQRAELIAAIFIINFLGLSIPVVIAGVVTAHVGLHRTALAYCVAMAALVAAAAGSLVLRSRGPATGQGTS